ncbi:YceD family protein [Propionibacterium freudenreichii]|uniref:YceD family protein n=1 Tax=Propionibacterium freudenreichii TaxID=1744 RepID=UPI00049FD0E3|nr:DUF177 domain-containing protein [Propionibacterium freudenreichii]MCT2974366.1 DUF177 domain-containing protein [Propionibacterium freudenreichii]MCT2976511.1 DUF177 domain-containing protein [Propionibacterium freudenreichii]MCT2989557.1 DUF177 domain-containing protein [Propionibacterium freudenreichii]MCT2997801.1 DUF177 domain-containing protein [Propionibacterium freudenreichii]MCT3002838.1 DUF177 domain-containing protein [Propionibacterium freudenreichii]
MSTHLDARNSLVIDTQQLARQAGAVMEVHDTVAAPADLGIEMIRVPEGAGIDLDLRLEAVVEGVLVTGTVEAPLEGECARCLTDLHDHGSYRVFELFNYEGRSAEPDDLFLDGELLDLDPVLRDAIVLDLPFTPLCRPDCKGLCPQCGANLNEHPDHHHEAPLDSRWSALKALTEPETGGIGAQNN